MYVEYVYNLSLTPDENVYHGKTEDLLMEMVSQRLAQVIK